jgi:hypothetical protein
MRQVASNSTSPEWRKAHRSVSEPDALYSLAKYKPEYLNDVFGELFRENDRVKMFEEPGEKNRMKL